MIIIHGDNQPLSRELLLSTKQLATKNGLEIISLDGEGLSLSDLQLYLNSANLLGKTNCVIIEGLFSRRPSNDKTKIVEYLTKNSEEEVVVWEGKDVAAQLKGFPAKIIRSFDLPKHVFKFLDNFTIEDLQKTLEVTAPELVFSMLSGQVRKLIMIKDNAGNLPAWQQGRLKSQSAKYDMEKLLSMHKDLIEIDFKNKTSATSLDLSAALELWVFKYT